MKKIIVTAVAALAVCWSAQAQLQPKCAVVNTQQVYQALDEYKAAVEELDALASSHQQKIDEAYAKLEQMYENYMVAKDGLSYEEQQSREQAIIDGEDKIVKYQQSVFGTDGIVEKKQEEIINPIIEKINQAITSYAKANNIDLLIDAATTTLPYYSENVDVTEEIIKALK